MIKRKKTDIIQFKVRMTEELRKQLETVARTEGRSLNTEIVRRLQASLVASELRSEKFQQAALEQARYWLRLAAQKAEESGTLNQAEVSELEIDPPNSENPAEGMDDISFH